MLQLMDSPGRYTPALIPELSILVVEDDPLVREATVWMLQDAGYLVHEAPDAQAALDRLAQPGRVDLVISDINMPGMDGLGFRNEVERRWPALPVMLVSGRPQPPGTRSFVAKPFGRAALMSAVADLVAPGRSHPCTHL